MRILFAVCTNCASFEAYGENGHSCLLAGPTYSNCTHSWKDLFDAKQYCIEMRKFADRHDPEQIYIFDAKARAMTPYRYAGQPRSFVVQCGTVLAVDDVTPPEHYSPAMRGLISSLERYQRAFKAGDLPDFFGFIDGQNAPGIDKYSSSPLTECAVLSNDEWSVILDHEQQTAVLAHMPPWRTNRFTNLYGPLPIQKMIRSLEEEIATASGNRRTISIEADGILPQTNVLSGQVVSPVMSNAVRLLGYYDRDSWSTNDNEEHVWPQTYCRLLDLMHGVRSSCRIPADSEVAVLPDRNWAVAIDHKTDRMWILEVFGEKPGHEKVRVIFGPGKLPYVLGSLSQDLARVEARNAAHRASNTLSSSSAITNGATQ